MLNKLTIAFVAGALAFASFPAFAVDIPDSGSKNFSPTGDTPSYFTNESTPISARTADTTERDWSAADDAAPAPSTAEAAPSRAPSGRHGKYASAQRSGKHTFGKSRGATHSAKASIGKTPKTASHYNAAAASAAKTTTAKHGKASARHAGAFPIDLAGLPKKA